MEQRDFFAGTVDRASSDALVNQFDVPVPGWNFKNGIAAVGPLVVCAYSIHQAAAGNGKVLLFYDGVPPADGSNWFGNANATQDVVRIVPIQPGGSFEYSPQFHRYLHQCSIVVSTTDAGVVNRASKNTLITVDFMPYYVQRTP